VGDQSLTHFSDARLMEIRRLLDEAHRKFLENLNNNNNINNSNSNDINNYSYSTPDNSLVNNNNNNIKHLVAGSSSRNIPPPSNYHPCSIPQFLSFNLFSQL